MTIPEEDPKKIDELSEKDLDAVSGGLSPQEIEERLRASLQGPRPTGGSFTYQRPEREKPLDPGSF